jgi:hypothetical protein
MMQGLEEISRMPASIVDLGVSAITKTRTVQGVSPVAMARASRQAVTKGFREFGQIMKNGATNAQLAALGLPDEIVSGSPILDTFINGSFRFQTAQDAVFKRYAITRSLEEQANLVARGEAAQGLIPKSQMAARADEIVKGVGISPAHLAEMQAQAVEDAAFQTFNNKNAFADWLDEGIRSLRPGTVKHFVADQLMPFRKTPMNIVARILDYSPIGMGKVTAHGFKLAKSVVQGAFDGEEQRAFAQAFGRATTGTAAIMVGYKLAEKGLASGVTGEKDFDKRTWNDTQGRLEGAVKVGNSWIEVSRYSPLGNLVALGASIYERSQTQGGKLTAKNLWKSVGQIAEEQPLTRTAGSINDLFTKPEKFGRDAVGSFVPSILGDVAGQLDSKEREATEWYEGAQKRLPGFRNRLPEKLDALGREIPSRANLNPLARSADRSTPAMKELERHNLMLDLPAPQPGESDANHRARVKRLGEFRQSRLNALVESEGYKKAGDDLQRAALEEAKRTASEDISHNRIVRRGDEHIILHNAKVSLERDKFLADQQGKNFYQDFSPTQKKAFDEEIKAAFGRIRARHAKDTSIGEALDLARDGLNDLLSDRQGIITQAKEKARGIK